MQDRPCASKRMPAEAPARNFQISGELRLHAAEPTVGNAATAVVLSAVATGSYRCIAVPGDAASKVGRLPSPTHISGPTRPGT